MINLQKWKVRLAEPIGPAECPQMVRWYFQTPIFGIRLHKFLRSDDRGNNGAYNKHDHPWPFITCILAGRYIDVYEKDGRECLSLMSRGKIAYRPALHRHRVVIEEGEVCWTLVLSGPAVRVWGFWHEGRFFPQKQWFKVFGHAPCE